MFNTVNFHQIPEGSRKLFLSLIDTEEQKLLGADPIFVAEEFCDLCEQAQEGFKPEPLMAPDFITPRASSTSRSRSRSRRKIRPSTSYSPGSPGRR